MLLDYPEDDKNKDVIPEYVEDTTPAALTLEQQFHYTTFCSTVDKMSREQAIDMLKQVHKQMLHKENLYKHFIKFNWGLGENSFKPSLGDANETT
jgi:hypothetical protein